MRTTVTLDPDIEAQLRATARERGAALAIEHGAELCSCDTDFARFSGLRWVNPLDAS